MLTEKEQKNKELVLSFFDFMNQHELDIDKLKKLFSEDYVEHQLFGQGDGFEGLLNRVKLDFKSFPNFKVEVQFALAEGDMVVCLYHDRGNFEGEFLGFQPTGKYYDIDGAHFFRVQDGLIVEHWACIDMLSLFTQLGVINQVVDSMNAQAV